MRVGICLKSRTWRFLVNDGTQNRKGEIMRPTSLFGSRIAALLAALVLIGSAGASQAGAPGHLIMAAGEKGVRNLLQPVAKLTYNGGFPRSRFGLVCNSHYVSGMSA